MEPLASLLAKTKTKHNIHKYRKVLSIRQLERLSSLGTSGEHHGSYIHMLENSAVLELFLFFNFLKVCAREERVEEKISVQMCKTYCM